MICTRHIGPDATIPEWLGAPCPDCGHTNLGHPGVTNLTLDACLICEVQATVQQLRDTITAQALADSQELAELRALVDGIDTQLVSTNGVLAAHDARLQQLEEPSMMGEGQ